MITIKAPVAEDVFTWRIADVADESSLPHAAATADDMWIVFVTADAERLRAKLLAGRPTPIEYPEPKPDSVLAEDDLIEGWPLNVAAENTSSSNTSCAATRRRL